MSLFGRGPRDGEPGHESTSVPRAPKTVAGTAGVRARPFNAPRSAADLAVPADGKLGGSSGSSAMTHGGKMANIGKSITIKGELTGNEDLEIDGNIDGRIDLPNNQLTIGAEGRIKAEITAKAVVVVGRVTGNILATDRIEVQATGIVDGDVKAPRLVVAEGAVLNGSVEMGGKKTPAQQAPLAPKVAAGGE